MNMPDMVGFGQMMNSSTPENLVMLGPKLNPAEAHGLEQWTNTDTTIEFGQLAEGQKENVQNQNAGWDVHFNEETPTE